MKAKLLTAAVLGGLMCAAASGETVLAGRYALEGVREVGSELVLADNGKFQFMLAYGALDLEARGTWRRDGNSVVLDTGLNDDPLFRLSRSKSTREGLRVAVKGPAGQAVRYVEVTVSGPSGTARGKTDEKGVAAFPGMASAESVSFHVPVYDVEAGPFALDSGRDDFEFVINGERITQVPFRDEHLKIQGSSLVLRFFGNGKEMVYRRL